MLGSNYLLMLLSSAKEKKGTTDFLEHIKKYISKLKVDTEIYESIEFEEPNATWYHRNHVIGNNTATAMINSIIGFYKAMNMLV